MNNRVLLVTSSFSAVDINDIRFIPDLSRSLAESFEVFVLAPPDGKSKLFEEWERVKIYRHRVTPIGDFGLCYGDGILPNIQKNLFRVFLIPFYLISQVFSIAYLVKKFDIKVIYANWLVPAGFSAVLFKTLFKRDLKILCTLRGSDMNLFLDPFSLLVKKFTLGGIDVLTAVSKQLSDKAHSLGYKKEIMILPTGVNTNEFFPVGNKTINNHKIIYVGRLIRSKGLELLVKAFALCLKKCPDASLTIIGEGDLSWDIKEQIKKLGISDAVTLVGEVKNSDLPKYYRDSDLFCLPSLTEGFSVSVSEAFSCGLPAVTNNIPVFKELESAYGILKSLNVENIEEFGETLAGVLLDTNFLLSVGKKVREYALKNLNRANTVQKYKIILKSLL